MVESAFKVSVEIPEQLQAEFQPAVDVGISQEVLDKVYKTFINKLVYLTARDLREVAKENAPYGMTGNLKKSIRLRKDEKGFNILASAPYAGFTEFGTGLYGMLAPPHYIYPKRAPYLVFRLKTGQWIRTERTAGQKPQLYMNRAMAQIGDSIDRAWNKMGTKLIVRVDVNA